MFSYWSIIIYIVPFIGYLELNPSLGNIWYRLDSTGKYSIQLNNLFQFFYLPFINKLFWYELLDLNIYFGIYIIDLLLFNYNKIITSDNPLPMV